MTKRAVKKVTSGVRDDIADLVTRRALPTHEVDHIDPFLFLNHHGPQTYSPRNHGLPFGPHPHRGFETVTFIIEGDIAHRDSSGSESVIKAGGIQWMTAGRGLVHEEVSSAEFMQRGGPLEVLQLWINLPAKLKMTKPRYIGLQSDQIPHLSAGDGVELDLISGSRHGTKGAVTPLYDITLMTIRMRAGSRTELDVPRGHNVFFYVVRGEVVANDKTAAQFKLVEFDSNDGVIEVQATTDAFILFGHAQPFNEPIVAHGPFVMNTREEITQAIRDYQAGKFGDSLER